MRRASPSEKPRRRRSPGANAEGTSNVPLRLSVAGGRLGLELYDAQSLGPLRVEELGWSLPGLRFPVDLSGGVNMFRHRRGELERLSVRVGFGGALDFVRPRLREALGRLAAPPRVWALEGGVGVGLVGERGALAFDLHFAPMEGQLWLIVGNARGLGEADVPLAQALRVAETLFGKLARRQGRLLVVEDMAGAIAREIAPSLGARTPHSSEIKLASVEISNEGLLLLFRASAPPPPLAAEALRALELAKLVSAGDDALAQGELDSARTLYMNALEQAPRHPELTANIAQIDASTAERAEAALGLLTDCLPATQFGGLGARLLAQKGDLVGARQAIINAASLEVYAPVAAGLWLMLSSLERDAAARHEALERAVACAPGLPEVRWARFEARLQAGNEAGAVADAEHIEAAARGPRERQRVLVKAATRVLEHRHPASAGKLFERALRYLPDEPDALYGLALALVGAAQYERAALLLGRAGDIAEDRNVPFDAAHIELGRLLAEKLDDQPQAIAHVSQISSSAPRAIEARALEGRWRAALGDLAGATLAFGRLREACEAGLRREADPRAAAWLVEAARFELTLANVTAAERHLGCALRLAPSDQRVRKLYREVARALLPKRS